MITPLPHNEILELNQSSWQAAGLAGWWPLGAHPTGRDLSLYGNHATGVTSGGATSSHRRGVNFDSGSCGKLTVPQNSVFDVATGDGFLISAWLNPDVVGASDYDSWLGMRTSSNQLILAYRYGNRVNLYIYNDSRSSYTSTVYSDTGTFVVGEWIHIVFGREADGTVLVYVNGIQNGNTATVTGPITNLGFDIGNDEYSPCSYSWDGLIDDVRWYNRALSANEVAAIYNETRDGGYGDLAAQPTKRLFHFSGTANLAPTAVTLTNKVDHLAEDADTTSATKIADIVVTDDGEGTNTLSVSGTDASSFEVVGTELRLKAGVTLDYEIKNSYAVTVEVDDTEVGSTPDLTVSHVLGILLVPENKQVDLVAGPSSSFDVVTEIRDERRGGTGRGVSWQPGPAQVVTYGTRSDPSTQAVLDRLDNRFVTSASDRFGKS
jgi:hypothetical protein